MPRKFGFTLSDSESEAEVEAPSPPSDEALENSLRETVAEIFKSGNMDELTVKRVRLAAETKLNLAAGYYKSTGVWKMRSEEIIKDEVATQDQIMLQPSSNVQKSPSPKSKMIAAPKRAKSQSAPKSRKRQKTASPVSEDDEMSLASGDESEEATKPKERSKAPIKKAPKKAPVKKRTEDVLDASDVPDDHSNATKPTQNTRENESESEMSVVLDEEPQPKAPRKRQKSAEGASTKTKKASKAKDDITPDQAEIKRLQGWLIKCGIRKLWGKELAPYDTPNAKIKHLKKMLEDAGMTGRPSQEKANQIREERELKADLELIQEGAKQWGADNDEEKNDGKPRRRQARARQSLAFLESDGEESDGGETE